MNSAELRTMVQELLLEELTAMRKTKSLTVAKTAKAAKGPDDACWVAMRAESDLAMFARRVLQLAEDPRRRQAIESGVFPFRFEHAISGNSISAVNPITSSAALQSQIDKGLVNEKHILHLTPETTILKLGKRATITPLARDKARKLGITITKES
jgi:hypothetical protein